MKVAILRFLPLLLPQCWAWETISMGRGSLRYCQCDLHPRLDLTSPESSLSSENSLSQIHSWCLSEVPSRGWHSSAGQRVLIFFIWVLDQRWFHESVFLDLKARLL